MTVTEYAEKEGTSRQNVLAKIRRGTLKARKCECGECWIIDGKEL